MSQQKSILKVGDRVQYIGSGSPMFGICGTVVEQAVHIRWRANQTTETYIPLLFDNGEYYAAYRRNLTKLNMFPTWEV